MRRGDKIASTMRRSLSSPLSRVSPLSLLAGGAQLRGEWRQRGSVDGCPAKVETAASAAGGESAVVDGSEAADPASAAAGGGSGVGVYSRGSGERTGTRWSRPSNLPHRFVVKKF